MTEVTHCARREAFAGLKSDQIKRLKDPEAENARLHRARSDFMLEKLILKDAASGTWQAPPRSRILQPMIS